MGRLRIEGLRFLDRGPVDMTVEGGECTALSGPSGSGKTLLLRAVADLDPHEGRLLLDGTDSSSIPPFEWRRQVAFLPAEPQWWRDRVGSHFPRADLRALKCLGFGPDVLDWSVSRLSTGERQRLAIVRLLTLEPAALLLDEPTANLDAENTRNVESLVAAYRKAKNAAVLWVTHDADQVRRVATRSIHIANGRLQTGEP